MPREVSFTVPLVPPSVNSYVRHSRGRHYVTAEAKAFKEAVSVIAAVTGSRLSRPTSEYSVVVFIWLGHNKRGDIDNFSKVLLDSLVYAGVIHSDAAVTELTLRKGRDAQNPRTEITVKEIAEIGGKPRRKKG
jgi:crossover junction endodeoxyribonuclease RusA